MSDDSAYTVEPTPPRRPLTALVDASRALGAAASLLDAAPSALRAVGGACDADLAVLWWEDRAFERLRRIATWRPFTTVDDRVVRLDGREHVRIGEDVPGRVWETGRAERDAAFVAIPIHIGNRVAGVLGLPAAGRRVHR